MKKLVLFLTVVAFATAGLQAVHPTPGKSSLRPIKTLAETALKNAQKTLNQPKYANVIVKEDEIRGLANALNSYANNVIGLPYMSPLVAELYNDVKDAYKQILTGPSSFTKNGVHNNVVISKEALAHLFIINLTTRIENHNFFEMSGSLQNLKKNELENLRNLSLPLVPSNFHTIKKVGNNKK